MASNDVYINPGTSRTWTDTGGDEELDLGGLAADGVMAGSYHDLGSGARPDTYEWEMVIDGFDSAPTAGRTVDLYFSQSNNATEFDGELITNPTDTNDAATGPTKNMLRNMLPAGSCVVHSTTAGDELRARGVVRLTARYVSPVVHNATAVALLSTSDAHKVILKPIPYQSQ